jgi:phosphate transport system protein
MGARVELMIHRAMEAFGNSDKELARGTMDLDAEVDQMEIEIDERCLRILAKRQPVASDLRFLTTTLKIVTDLERVADLASNVCVRVAELENHLLTGAKESIQRMGRTADTMLRDALDAFVHRDAARARSVLARDEMIDKEYTALFPILMTAMLEKPENVYPAQRLQSVGKYVERIGDHATNIAEMVIFMVRGEDMRHLSGAGSRFHA